MKMSPISGKSYLPISPEAGGAREALKWYVANFGAKVKSAYDKDGKVIHAEFEIGNSGFMCSDAFPGYSKSPKDLGGCPITMFIEYKSGSKEVYDLAIKNGAKVPEGREYKEQPWGWNAGSVEDPFGYTWTIGEDAKHWSDADLSDAMKTKNIASEF